MLRLCSRLLPCAAALAAGLFCAAPAASAAPVIVNGSFELPSYPAGTVNPGGGDGWIASFMGGVSIISGNIRDNNGKLYGVTPYGTQYLGLDPNNRGFISRDSQEIDGFVAGQTYQLTLEAADSDGGLAPVLNINFNDGSLVNYFDRDYPLPVGGPYGDVIQFNQYAATFTAPVSGVITLSLTNVGVGSDPGSISIDDVQLAAVPGPAVNFLDSFDYQGNSTVGSAVNLSGAIDGTFVNATDGGKAGYLRAPDGSLSAPIIDPLDTNTPSTTEANGLDDSGTICGSYLNPADGLRHGYLLTDGNFTDFTVDGPLSTSLRAINNAGDFVGFSNPVGTDPGQAFIHIGGITTYLPFTGATASSAEGINDAGDVVGYYIDQHGASHGFLRPAASGIAKPVNYPSATSTALGGINNRHEIAGSYVSGGVTHGFVRKGAGAYLTYDYPGATATVLNGIDDHGVATGTYTDSAGQEHALVVRVALTPPAEGSSSGQ